ncbi:MAG: response regulator [Chloroflexi bacterium]|nr:response regulator [Chloroflexota bacterium]
MKNWNLLVVEDDPDGREVVGRLLRYHKIAYQTADNGEEALQNLEEKRFTGAIIDLALPGIDGWSLLRAIRQNPQTAHLPCVAITAFHSAELALKAIEAGFTAYFPKPLDSTAFVRELERIL